MKKILVLIVAGLLYFNPSIGQGIKEGTIKSGNNEYIVKPSNNQIIVSNKKNGLVKTDTKLPEDLIRSGLSSFLTYNQDEAKRLLNIIKADFAKRGRTIPAERLFGVFYIGKEGEILETDFILSENTNLSIDDINALEIALKEQFRFKVTKGKLGSAKYVIWNTTIRLDEIANK